MDSTFSHAAWAATLGGISLPLLSDFHPKGEIAGSLGVYLEDRGITDRATVLLDAGGTVRHASSVTPAGRRDIAELAALAEQVDADWRGPVESIPIRQPDLPDRARLYVKDRCMFSRWALYARTNLHLEAHLPVVNVSRDEAALQHLVAAGGKPQAPALVCDDDVLYESADIIAWMRERAGPAL